MKKKKWIKRGCLWTICLVIMLCTVSAQAMSIPEAVGRWYFVSADGIGLPEGIYVEFNRDRSVTMVVGENTADTIGLTWEIYEEKILIKSQGSRVFTLDYDGTSLTCLTEQLTTILGLAKENHFYKFALSRTPNTYDIPELQPAASEDLFFGEYEHYLTVTDGQYIPVNSGERTITIADYVLTETVNGETREYLTDFNNSVLHVYAKEEWIYAVTSDPDILVANLSMDGTGKYRYFRRTGTADKTDETQTDGSENDNTATITGGKQASVPDGQPILEAIESLAKEEETEYNACWRIVWNPNGSTGPWRIESRYGGLKAEDGIIGNKYELSNQYLDTEREMISIEPGATYAFRIVSGEEDQEQVSEWIEAKVPTFSEKSDLRITAIYVPSVTLQALQTGDGIWPGVTLEQMKKKEVYPSQYHGWPDKLTIDTQGFSLRQQRMIYAISPVDQPNKTFTGCLTITDGRFDIDRIIWRLMDIMTNNFADQKREYEFRLYINGEKVGNTVFSVE